MFKVKDRVSTIDTYETGYIKYIIGKLCTIVTDQGIVLENIPEAEIIRVLY